MGNGQVIRLFIIYAWRYHEVYEQLVSALDKQPDFLWMNNSVPRETSSSWADCSRADIEDYLTARIKSSDCVLIILSENIAREWIHFEVQAARTLGKPIIGIKTDSSSSHYLSIVKPDRIISPDNVSIINSLASMVFNESKQN